MTLSHPHKVYAPIKEVAQILGATSFRPDTGDLPEDILAGAYIHCRDGHGSPVYVFIDRETENVVIQAGNSRAFNKLLSRFAPWEPTTDGRNIIYTPTQQTLRLFTELAD